MEGHFILDWGPECFVPAAFFPICLNYSNIELPDKGDVGFLTQLGLKSSFWQHKTNIFPTGYTQSLPQFQNPMF